MAAAGDEGRGGPEPDDRDLAGRRRLAPGHRPEERRPRREVVQRPRPEAKRTKVPWIIQDAFPGYHGVAWYWRDFAAPANPHAGGRYLLRFWAVDYRPRSGSTARRSAGTKAARRRSCST